MTEFVTTTREPLQASDTQVAPELTVIVVNWNVGPLVVECLKTVFELTRQVTFEIYVVDNGSRHGDLDQARRAFPQVNYVFLDRNEGFAKANNVGIARARGKFIALLNPDTRLMNGALDAMTAHLRRRDDVGAAGPKLVTPDGSVQFDAARNLPTLRTEFCQQFFLYKLFPKSRAWGAYYMGWWDHQDRRDVGALCGACMMVRAEVVKQVGALDENFFLYWEDVEWCYRIRQAGWKVSYLPEAEVKHLGGHSMAQDSVASRQNYFTSCVHFYRKHYGLAAALVARALLLGGGILRIFLWLALSINRHRRTEARNRLRCYWRAVFSIFGDLSVQRP